MAPLPPVPGVFKAQLFYDIFGFGGANVLHFSYSGGPPDAATCAAFATTLRTSYASTIASNFASTIALIATVVTDLSSTSGASGQDLTDVPGTDFNQPVPVQLATVVKWPVSLRYRGGHPKTFFPPMIQAHTANMSQWTDGAAGSFGLGAQSMIAGVVGVTHGGTTCTGHVAVSYFTDHLPRLAPLVLTLGNGICDTRIGSQRRRRLQPVSL